MPPPRKRRRIEHNHAAGCRSAATGPPLPLELFAVVAGFLAPTSRTVCRLSLASRGLHALLLPRRMSLVRIERIVQRVGRPPLGRAAVMRRLHCFLADAFGTDKSRHTRRLEFRRFLTDEGLGATYSKGEPFVPESMPDDD
ncbi:hypothetical protein DFJ74DRAFT_647244 [Hyaloraphidium curvatum]|nr:hypothetical protein DFJ74DRAFT_647244 [Hyaloraphidium curvatum]